MSQLIDYYEVLQVSPNASQEVIEAAYKRLAKIHHPDVGGDAQTMTQINQAYTVLGNPNEREAYNSIYFAHKYAGASETIEDEAWADIFAEMIKPRPWPRFMARYIDSLLWIWVFVLVVYPFIPYSFWVSIGADSSLIFGLITLIFFVPVEAAMISAFGTTPGKQLLQIRVVTIEGNTLPYINALRRSFGAFGWGIGLGIPFVTLICMYLSRNSLMTWGITKWDASAQSIVIHKDISLTRSIIATLIMIGLLLSIYH